ncbi:MAG TPA: nucleotide exchange factor GrpE [Bacteroidota bacterium]
MDGFPDFDAPEDEAGKALLEELDSLRTELASQKDSFLRLAADFDNFRKRTVRETEHRGAAQKEAFIRELLPVVDNLERALASPAGSAEHLREGVQLTLQQMHLLLRRHGIEPEESMGEQFDPHRHEAIAAGYDPAKPDHAILEVFRRGYRRGDAMFRPAKVIVNNLNRAEAESHGG